jgi:hypothetical protein
MSRHHVGKPLGMFMQPFGKSYIDINFQKRLWQLTIWSLKASKSDQPMQTTIMVH